MWKLSVIKARLMETSTINLSLIAIISILVTLFINFLLVEKGIDVLTNSVSVDLNNEIVEVQNYLPEETELNNVVLFEKDALGDVFSYLSTILAVLALLISAIAVVITYLFSKRVQESTDAALKIANDTYILSTEESLQRTLNGTLTAFKEIDRLYNYGIKFLQLKFHEPFDLKAPPKYNDLKTSLSYYFADYRAEFEALDLSKRKTCITGYTLKNYFDLEESINQISEKDLVLTMPYFFQFYQKDMDFMQLVNEEVFFKDKPIKKYEFIMIYIELVNKMIDIIIKFIETEILTREVDFDLQIELIRFKNEKAAKFKESYNAFKSNKASGLNLEDLSLVNDLTQLANNSLQVDDLRIKALGDKNLNTILNSIKDGETTPEQQYDELLKQFEQYLMHDLPKIQIQVFNSLKETVNKAKGIHENKIEHQLKLRKDNGFIKNVGNQTL